MKHQVEAMIYETPQIEIIVVEVEKGFAASPDGGETPDYDI